MPYILESQPALGTVQRIRREAERRMRVGILVGGQPFQADDASTQRVGEMLAAFQDGLVGAEGVRFRTASGTSFAVTNASLVQSIYDAQRRYRAACLAASDTLQADPPADPEADAHWPVPETIALS